MHHLPYTILAIIRADTYTIHNWHLSFRQFIDTPPMALKSLSISTTIVVSAFSWISVWVRRFQVTLLVTSSRGTSLRSPGGTTSRDFQWSRGSCILPVSGSCCRRDIPAIVPDATVRGRGNLWGVALSVPTLLSCPWSFWNRVRVTFLVWPMSTIQTGWDQKELPRLGGFSVWVRRMMLVPIILVPRSVWDCWMSGLGPKICCSPWGAAKGPFQKAIHQGPKNPEARYSSTTPA